MKEAIIPCAGRGERMGSLTDDISKPMIPFDGVPFLQFVIQKLNEAGIERFIIPVGYKGEVIKEYFGDGSKFGVEIVYADSTVEAESGGSFKRGLKFLQGDSCLMQYGDAYFPGDIKGFIQAFEESGKKSMVIASQRYTIEGFADKNNLEVDSNGLVLNYGKGNPNAKHLDVGVACFRKEVSEMFGDQEEFKLAPFIFPKLAEERELMAFSTDIKSVGIGNVEKIERYKKFLEGKDLYEKAKALKKE